MGSGIPDAKDVLKKAVAYFLVTAIFAILIIITYNLFVNGWRQL